MKAPCSICRFAQFCTPLLQRGFPYTDRMKTPQQLGREALDEFKAAYQEEFGEAISDAQAHEMAVRLLRFFGVLAKPPDPTDIR